ncbi:Ferritin-like metal-binding protein YciE [Flavobacteriaceae bacterium MAR_2010_188]|nr:Ferritin-like metal-binding protein YciE [Flavobacteriaceae bacterium MAR_2010_188]
MKNLEELFISELKNLYAMEKQIAATMQELKPLNNSDLDKRISKISNKNSADYEVIKALLQKHSVNPGSTTDSVVAEILTNIKSENSSDITAKVKEAGQLASYNRLMAYKSANYENTSRMAKTLKMKKARKKLKNILETSLKYQNKVKKLAKKSIYKEAV